jgi:hypothetical protein
LTNSQILSDGERPRDYFASCHVRFQKAKWGKGNKNEHPGLSTWNPRVLVYEVRWCVLCGGLLLGRPGLARSKIKNWPGHRPNAERERELSFRQVWEATLHFHVSVEFRFLLMVDEVLCLLVLCALCLLCSPCCVPAFVKFRGNGS